MVDLVSMGMVFYSIDLEMRPTKVGIKYPKIASLDVSHFVASTTNTNNLRSYERSFVDDNNATNA